MSLEAVREARNQIESAEKTLRSTAKETIKSELEAVFLNNPDVTTVTWAQKVGEYNDEGMYPGVFGPSVNLEGADDEDLDLSDFVSAGAGYDLLYWSDRANTDARVQRLAEVLNAVGEEVLSDLYGSENIVIVQRTPNGARVIAEYVGC